MVSDMTAYTGMLIKHKGTPLNSQEIFTTVEIKKIKSDDILKIQVKANHSNIHQPLYTSFL